MNCQRILTILFAATLLNYEQVQVVVVAGQDPVSVWRIPGWEVGGMNSDVTGKMVCEKQCKLMSCQQFHIVLFAEPLLTDERE